VSTALEELRAANTADVKLPVSGLTATIQLPRVRDCIIAGDVPMPVLAHIDQSVLDGDVPDLTAEQMKAVAAFNDGLVLASLKALDGDPVDLSAEDLSLFDEEDLQEIVLYASRAKPLPGKD
jgi:hypothetical protein